MYEIDQELKYIEREGFTLDTSKTIGSTRVYVKPQLDAYVKNGKVIGNYQIAITKVNGEDTISGIYFIPNGRALCVLDLEVVYHYVRCIREVFTDIELGWGFKYGL